MSGEKRLEKSVMWWHGKDKSKVADRWNKENTNSLGSLAIDPNLLPYYFSVSQLHFGKLYSFCHHEIICDRFVSLV